jgi:hypothetical protein
VRGRREGGQGGGGSLWCELSSSHTQTHLMALRQGQGRDVGDPTVHEEGHKGVVAEQAPGELKGPQLQAAHKLGGPQEGAAV